MIHISLLNNTIKQFESIPTGMDVAKSISEEFAKRCVAIVVDGEMRDLTQNITQDAQVRLLTENDPEAIEILRHSTAHVMAQAICRIYPNAKLAIGPVIENGFYYDIDMPPVSEDDFTKIETEMNKIIQAKLPIQRQDISKQNAMDMFVHEPYKRELIQDLDEGTIRMYQQGEFTDLCRGPHLPHTGFIKAFKLMKVSGAYWRADASKAQLQRIYGTAFFSKKELTAHLNFIEEAKKRDHRKIGSALELFSFHDEAPGMPFFHPKGMVMWNLLLDYWRKEHQAAGYVEIKTPVILNRLLWEKSGHWFNYKENMYTTSIDEMDYAIKPMNCPGGMLVYGLKSHSYKELPLRMAEIGLVHRHELSGVLSGLFRVRAFHQDDAHIFMTPDQIEAEILGVLKLMERIYHTFGLTFHVELSTRPKKSIGTDAQWEQATNGLKSALQIYGQEFKINEGDGAFYGPKIDIHIKDALGRTWQCGTIQLDMSLPERFDLTYVGNENDKHRPIMIHRVIYGSIERFFGILIEHFAGKFPCWLTPVQAVCLPLNDSLAPYCEHVYQRLLSHGIRIELDSRSETLQKRIREAQLNKIPLIITIGEKEKTSGKLSVRTLDGQVTYGIDEQTVVNYVKNHIESKRMDMEKFTS
ncbi:MAG: threonine--tRNA ligase [Desulfobacterales bacterium]|nr:threonine--tRNA ligase [Desulfobacterales bacterium]